MTTAQRDAINLNNGGPIEGLTIYNTTLKTVQVYNGTSWASTLHYIGESYGGGKVFFVYDNGQHGLIAANSDISTTSYAFDPNTFDFVATSVFTFKWSDSYTNTGTEFDINTGVGPNGIGAGTRNTTLIVANQGVANNTKYAAKVCNSYNIAVNDVTYGDWYLPSLYELNLLYLNRTASGANMQATKYWTSNESDQNYAWWIDFGDNGRIDAALNANGEGKKGEIRVRAIRAF
jgi:hypothetical protein